MKLLAEITETSLDLDSPDEVLGRNYKFRKSARAILLNDKNEVSLQFVSKKGYYKLPGGGVDPGETEEEALRRELIEEVGCDSTIEKPLGIIIEYRTKLNLLHISYGYLCRVKGVLGSPSYEPGEVADGFEPVWVSVDEGVRLLGADATVGYEGKFIIHREHIFLAEAKRALDVKP